MNIERAMKLVEARNERLCAQYAAPYFAAAAAFSSVAKLSSRASSTGSDLSNAFASMFSGVSTESIVNSAFNTACAIAELAADHTDVARWNLANRGYRLPLP